jgi:hypothetical protein
MAHSIDYTTIPSSEEDINKKRVQEQWKKLKWYEWITYKVLDGIGDLFGLEGEAHFYAVPKFKVVEYTEWSVVDISVSHSRNPLRFRLYPSDFSIDDFCKAVRELKLYEKTGKKIWILCNPSRGTSDTNGSIMRIIDKNEKNQDETSKVIITLDMPKDWGIAI